MPHSAQIPVEKYGWVGGWARVKVKLAQSLSSFRQAEQWLIYLECQALCWAHMGQRNGRGWLSILGEFTGHVEGVAGSVFE